LLSAKRRAATATHPIASIAQSRSIAAQNSTDRNDNPASRDNHAEIGEGPQLSLIVGEYWTANSAVFCKVADQTSIATRGLCA
jgi:hypothetical protein